MSNQSPSFFDKAPEAWTGKVVSIVSQKEQVSGLGWGTRYKVRIFGQYSENDNIDDKDVHTATVMMSPTDGSGAAGRMRTVKITQGDIVYGVFMAPDQGFPVIQGVLGQTRDKVNSGGKFGSESGFTESKKPGLTGRQESNEQNGVTIPGILNCKDNVGGGVGKSSPKEAFQKMGLDANLPSELGSISKPDSSKTDKNILKPDSYVNKPTNELQVGESNDETIRDALQEEENVRAWNSGETPREVNVNLVDGGGSEPNYGTPEWDEWNRKESEYVRNNPDSSGFTLQ